MNSGMAQYCFIVIKQLHFPRFFVPKEQRDSVILMKMNAEVGGSK
jgi:hypothetical protein